MSRGTDHGLSRYATMHNPTLLAAALLLGCLMLAGCAAPETDEGEGSASSHETKNTAKKAVITAPANPVSPTKEPPIDPSGLTSPAGPSGPPSGSKGVPGGGSAPPMPTTAPAGPSTEQPSTGGSAEAPVNDPEAGEAGGEDPTPTEGGGDDEGGGFGDGGGDGGD